LKPQKDEEAELNQGMALTRQEIIVQIGTATSIAEAYVLFKLNLSLLENCKFIFASASGPAPGFSVNRTFSCGAVVRSLFHTEKVIVLDKDTIKEMDSGGAAFPIDYSISLDTQAISYLKPYLEGQLTRIPKDFKEVFEFISQDSVNIDPLPYISENYHNLQSEHGQARIFGILKAYEILRTIDTKWLQEHNEVKSVLPESELSTRAQVFISRMFMDQANKTALAGLDFSQQSMYALLLKMAEIQLNLPQESAKSKILEFLTFCDKELATIFMRETVIARAFFTRGQKLEFFAKIQRNKSDLLHILNGMAWDLWHVRQLELSLTLRPAPQARYFFPALLTFDKRFIEIIDLYPLKALAYVDGINQPIPFFNGDWIKLIAGDDETQAAITEKFYSSDARTNRAHRRKCMKEKIAMTVSALEAKLRKIAAIE
jgi:hypothetical protein